MQHFLASAVGAAAAETQTALLEAAAKARGKFTAGDLVLIRRGDLKGLQGEVTEVDEAADSVKVLPKNIEGLNEALEFKFGDLQKSVAVGARVRVRPACPFMLLETRRDDSVCPARPAQAPAW